MTLEAPQASPSPSEQSAAQQVHAGATHAEIIPGDPHSDPQHPHNLPREIQTLSGPTTLSGPYTIERRSPTYVVRDAAGQTAFSGIWSKRTAEQMAFGEAATQSLPRRVGNFALRLVGRG